MNNKIEPQCRISDKLIPEVGGEVMLYNLETNRDFLLNPISSKVWQLCDGIDPLSKLPVGSVEIPIRRFPKI
jgi:hypothetical protein